MTGIFLCGLSFVSCLLCTLRNWRFGLSALITWGYFFGILKAHYFASWGHFIFDSATVGFYAGLIIKAPTREEQACWKPLIPWVVWLIVWPLFMALIPIQHYLVQLVGLRGNMFWIPMLLVGAMLDRTGRNLLLITFAFLNIGAFGFALAEYFLGVEVFVPDNEVTQIIFNSNDISGGHSRIPATFANAHAYAGTMVLTISWLVSGLIDKKERSRPSPLRLAILFMGLVSALLGIFIAGPRLPVVVLGLLVAGSLLTSRINFQFTLVLILAGTLVGYFVAQNDRMQRFTELQNLESVSSRIGMSVSMSFIDVLSDYPMGNGMGAGGTSLPFFAQAYLTKAVVLENEYARILLEQGLPGLVIFLSFLVCFFTLKFAKTDEARIGKTQVWIVSAVTFSTSWIGIGLMSTIPSTALLMLGVGYCFSPTIRNIVGVNISRPVNTKLYSSAIPAYQRGLARF